MEIRISFKGHSCKFQECYERLSKKFQGCFMKGSRMFKNGDKVDFQEAFMEVSKKFQKMLIVVQGSSVFAKLSSSRLVQLN